MTEKMTTQEQAQQAFDNFCAGYDLFGDQWLNMGADEYFIAGYKAALQANHNQEIKPKKEMAWECNECGSQEYTMALSEADVRNLGCGRCGGDEWHKAEART